MLNISEYAQTITESGVAIVPQVFADERIGTLIRAIEEAGENSTPDQGVRRRVAVYAIRNLVEVVPSIRDVVRSPEMRALIEPVLGNRSFMVRGLLFDKTPEANWKVAYHQDLTIAVRERAEMEGFGRWSIKAGVVHVQPPIDILVRMLIIRLHLDKCNLENAALRVIPGSHAHGRLSEAEIEHWKNSNPEMVCNMNPGGVVAMRPLLLHASSEASTPLHRRVIHLEFSADKLPGPLDWYEKQSI